VPPFNSSKPALLDLVLPTIESLRANAQLFSNITLAMQAAGDNSSLINYLVLSSSNISDAIHALPLDGSNVTAEELTAIRDTLAGRMTELANLTGINAAGFNMIGRETSARTLAPFTPPFDFINNPVAKRFGGVDGNYTQPGEQILVFFFNVEKVLTRDMVGRKKSLLLALPRASGRHTTTRTFTFSRTVLAGLLVRMPLLRCVD
jgi:hypothetical protein